APTTVWDIVSAEAMDATGNRVKARGNPASELGESYVRFQPELWPTESAWRLRIGVSHRAYFEPDELWRLSDLSLRAPNDPVHTTTLQGRLLQLTLPSAERSRALIFRVTPASPDYRVTIIRAINDLGEPVRVEQVFSEGGEFKLSTGFDATRLTELTL